MFITGSNQGKVLPPRTEPASWAFTATATVRLDGDDRELADPAGQQPVPPEPVCGQQVVDGTVSELCLDGGPVGQEGAEEGSCDQPVRTAALTNPAHVQTDLRQPGDQLCQRYRPDRVRGGHCLPLPVGERLALLHGEGE